MRSVAGIFLFAALLFSVFSFGYILGDIRHYDNEMQRLEREIKVEQLENLRLQRAKLEKEVEE